jgi:hypothetical protein
MPATPYPGRQRLQFAAVPLPTVVPVVPVAQPTQDDGLLLWVFGLYVPALQVKHDETLDCMDSVLYLPVGHGFFAL